MPDTSVSATSHPAATDAPFRLPAARFSRRHRRSRIRSRPRRHDRRLDNCACAATPTRRRRCAAAARRRRTRAGRAGARWPTARRGRLPHRAGRCAGHCRSARQLHAGGPDADRPGAQHGAVGSVHFRRQFLHAMRARGVSPDHVFPRPARRDGALHGDDARRQDALSGAAVERQPGRVRRACPDGTALGALGRSAPETVLPVRAGRRRSGPGRGQVHDRIGPRCAAGDLGPARRRGQMRATRWRR